MAPRERRPYLRFLDRAQWALWLLAGLACLMLGPTQPSQLTCPGQAAMVCPKLPSTL